MSLGDIAAKQGFPVFPCDADKRPLDKGGFHTATRDLPAIMLAFARSGAQLIGVPTGVPSGLIVIDVDVKPGRESGMTWLDGHRCDLPETRTHKTRSGGLHLLFRQPKGVSIRNSAGRIAPGVDVRGDGGYIIIPPSPGYAIADQKEPAEMPAWLIKLCAAQEHDRPKATEYAPSTSGSTRYGLAALEEECRNVRMANFGQQELTLNNAALKIGALVAGGHIVKSVAQSELIAAGNSMSSEPGEPAWTSNQISEKVKRGLDDGASRPRGPEPTHAPQKPVQEAEQRPAVKTETFLDPEIENENPYPLVWFENIEPSLDSNDFVQDVLMETAASVVYGESNAGKTFFATDMALHVAAGITWAGKRVEQGAVIYCVLEGGRGFRNRVAAWRSAHYLDGVAVPFAAIPSAINLLDPEADTEKLIKQICSVMLQLHIPVKMVVIDTLSRAMAGGNENAPDDMGALVMNMDRIREVTRSHVMFIHHSGKDQAKGARGHSLLRAAIDTEIEVVAQEGSEAKTATIVKQREGKKGQVFNFTLSVHKLGDNRHSEPVTTCLVVHSDQAAGAAADRQTRLGGASKRALEVLSHVITEQGKAGFAGTPDGFLSVPEKWWRDRFYEEAMPGAEYEAKKKGFRRAADTLVEAQQVGMASGRCWIVNRKQKQGFKLSIVSDTNGGTF